MDRRFTSAVSLFLAFASTLHEAPRLVAQPAGPLTAEQVRASIDGAVKFLLTEQNEASGAWTDIPRYPGGVTALCTLSLLNAGVEPSDPRIQKALKFLRKIEPTQTYSAALQTMVFCEAEPRSDLPLIQRNVNWLESIQQPGGQWSYAAPPGGDNSNSQFAILALHEAERAGATFFF